MVIEIAIGTAVLLVAALVLFVYPIFLFVILGLICFALIAYMVGAVIQECMPGYKGR
jgi:hypothetical protein